MPSQSNEKVSESHCTERHLSDNELFIGDQARKFLACLNPAKQRLAILGINAFNIATCSHLQSRLSLDIKLLKDIGCLNSTQKESETYRYLHPESSEASTTARCLVSAAWMSGDCYKRIKNCLNVVVLSGFIITGILYSCLSNNNYE